MSKGFAQRQNKYCLNIIANAISFPVHFVVNWQGNQAKTHKQAMDTATSIWAIAHHGKNCDGFSLVAEALGEDCVEQLLAIHEQLKGQKFIGKLRDLQTKSNFMMMVFGTELGLIPQLEEVNSLPAIERLA